MENDLSQSMIHEQLDLISMTISTSLTTTIHRCRRLRQALQK